MKEREGGRLVVSARNVIRESGPGASVAVNGVCLTVVAADEAGGSLAFDLSPETLARTSLDGLRPGASVNLERPVSLLSRLGGHLVQGHVDGVGRVAQVVDRDGGSEMQIDIPEPLARYVVEKGSVAVDGVSLTVSSSEGSRFGVALIPYTLEATTLGTAKAGDAVNVEVDVMAKYVEGLLRWRQ